MKNEVLLEKRRVVIEVRRGVAEVTAAPEDVEVEIMDHDNASAPEEEES
jgi:hypothetical protein